MTQTIANPTTNKKLGKRYVFRALLVPATWTMAAAVRLLKSEGSEKHPCRYILINNSYFVFGDDESDAQNGHPLTCMIPPPELLAEWNKTRFVESD